MNMLTIVCNQRFDDEIQALFLMNNIKGYTVIAGVGGSGVTGDVSTGHGWTDKNTLYLITLNEDQMLPLINAVKEVHVRLVAERHGHEVPLKVFLQPCEVIV